MSGFEVILISWATGVVTGASIVLLITAINS